MEKIIFVDRDGVLNRDAENGYVDSPEKVEVFPFAAQAVRKLTERGFKTIIISNQAGIAKGLYTAQVLESITVKILNGIERSGGKIHAVYYCPHREEDRCSCRKPKTGLFEQALADTPFERGAAFMVGDSERDITAGKSFGLKTILVLSGKTKTVREAENFAFRPDNTAADLLEAVDTIVLKS